MLIGTGEGEWHWSATASMSHKLQVFYLLLHAGGDFARCFSTTPSPSLHLKMFSWLLYPKVKLFAAIF
jgi:hypothetical protein